MLKERPVIIATIDEFADRLIELGVRLKECRASDDYPNNIDERHILIEDAAIFLMDRLRAIESNVRDTLEAPLVGRALGALGIRDQTAFFMNDLLAERCNLKHLAKQAPSPNNLFERQSILENLAISLAYRVERMPRMGLC